MSHSIVRRSHGRGPDLVPFCVRLQRWSLCFTLGATVAGFLGGCTTIPRQYVRIAEPGLTLTELTAHPDRYRGKVALLGGTVAEVDEQDQDLFLRVTNRPLDQDYIPHRPMGMQGPEAGHYWVQVAKQQLPREYRHWARITMAGRVTGTQRLGNEPVLSLLYVRGWGMTSTHDGEWEHSSDPNSYLEPPVNLGGEIGGTLP